MDEEIRQIEKDGLNDVEGGNYSEESSFEEPFQDSSSDASLPSNSDTESEHQLSDSVDEASKDVEGRDDGNNEQRDSGDPRDVRKRVADALRLHPNTVSAISKDIKEGRPLSSPKKTGHRKKPLTDIDDFDKMAIWNAIYDMCQDKQHVTFISLHNMLQERGI
ncbi:hypothetical protein QE152_g17949 [Popillia japonica]|uniref:Uncharacterized protein n=1 Tax=Popillia japonica TaxID=7064 RepID=A0AAW1L532_POPJA